MRNRAAWFAAAVFWTLFGLLTGLQVWISMITHGHSVPLLLGYYIAVWISWLGISALIARITQRWPFIPLTARAVLIHILAACVIALAHIAYWITLTFALEPYHPLTVVWADTEVMKIVLSRFPLELILYAAVAATIQAAEYYAKYRQRELEAAHLEASLSGARLHALELQLQPHFLFNTLNAISSLVRARQHDAAVVMIAGLSDLLRYTLDHADDQQVALGDEIAMLERYLDIQRTRFGDRMTFHIDVEPEAARIAVPTLMLQPLAENAVRHGIARASGPGFVTLRAFRDGDRLAIEMKNTGRLEETPSFGIGLQNTIDRLRQLYGESQQFELSEQAGVVMARVSIPWAVRP